MQDDGALLFRPVEDVRATMGQLRGLGVDIVRLTANWAALAPAGDSRARPSFDATNPAAYDQDAWRSLDNAVSIANQVGLGVDIDIGLFAPVWATTDASGPRARTNIDAREYAAFATAIARRYSGSWAVPTPPSPAPAPPPVSPEQQLLNEIFGTGGQPVAQPPPPPGPLPAVQIFTLWNEPNHDGLFRPQWSARGRHARALSPGIYRRMVLAAYPAIKAIDPGSRVLIGNTSSIGSYRGVGGVPPLRFLRELACVDSRFKPLRTQACAGLAPLPGDGWAHHPYTANFPPDTRSTPATPDNARLADLPRLSATLDRLAAMGRISQGDRDIYLTEFGYETQSVFGRKALSAATQARYLTWAEYLAARVPAVRIFAQFLLRDQPPGKVRLSDNPSRAFGQWYSGLEYANGVPKVSLSTFVAGLYAQRQSARVTMLYGRLRLGSGPHRILLQRQLRGGSWSPVATVARGAPQSAGELSVDGRATFVRYTPYVAGAIYRLSYVNLDGSWAPQLPVGVLPLGR